MDSPCIFLGIKVKPGPIERFKLENYTLDNTVDHLKAEAEKKANVPSASLELIHHGKILKANATLQDSGVKNGEMVHVVKKKQEETATPRATYTDAELQNLNSALRALGCTPNAPGWTRAMQNLASFIISQLLNEESVMNEILDVAPSLGEDCVALSILHEVELLAALGTNIQTMRRGAEAHPELPAALMHLVQLEQARASTAQPNDNNSPTISGFAYSLEALSEEEDAEDEEAEETERNTITQEQLAAALQAATEAVSSSRAIEETAVGSSRQSFLQMLRGAAGGETSRNFPHITRGPRAVITPEMFSEAISQAMSRSGAGAVATPAVATPVGATPAVATIADATSADATPAVTPMDQTTTEVSAGRAVITPEAFNEALSEAISRSDTAHATPMEHSTQGSSSQSPAPRDEDFTTQLEHMHEMGLLDDAVNVRALLICTGDVNAAINLVFSGGIGDD